MHFWKISNGLAILALAKIKNISKIWLVWPLLAKWLTTADFSEMHIKWSDIDWTFIEWLWESSGKKMQIGSGDYEALFVLIWWNHFIVPTILLNA